MRYSFGVAVLRDLQKPSREQKGPDVLRDVELSVRFGGKTFFPGRFQMIRVFSAWDTW